MSLDTEWLIKKNKHFTPIKGHKNVSTLYHTAIVYSSLLYFGSMSLIT